MRYVILGLLLLSMVSAANQLDELSVYVAPKDAAGDRQANFSINYVFNFTTNQDCTGVLFSHPETITTDRYGVATTNINLSGLSTTPNYLCEYREGVLNQTHYLNNNLFESYPQNCNVTGSCPNLGYKDQVEYFTGGWVMNGSAGSGWYADNNAVDQFGAFYFRDADAAGNNYDWRYDVTDDSVRVTGAATIGSPSLKLENSNLVVKGSGAGDTFIALGTTGSNLGPEIKFRDATEQTLGYDGNTFLFSDNVTVDNELHLYSVDNQADRPGLWLYGSRTGGPPTTRGGYLAMRQTRGGDWGYLWAEKNTDKWYFGRTLFSAATAGLWLDVATGEANFGNAIAAGAPSPLRSFHFRDNVDCTDAESDTVCYFRFGRGGNNVSVGYGSAFEHETLIGGSSVATGAYTAYEVTSDNATDQLGNWSVYLRDSSTSTVTSAEGLPAKLRISDNLTVHYQDVEVTGDLTVNGNLHVQGCITYDAGNTTLGSCI